MRNCRNVFVVLVACVFTAGNLVVTASAAPAVRAFGKVATQKSRAGAHSWKQKSATVQPQRVDFAMLPRGKQAPARSAAQLPLLVRDEAAYAAAKQNPKATPGLAITEGEAAPTARRLAPQVPSLVHNFQGINSTDVDNLTASNSPPEPPDTQIAVGPTRVIEMVNNEVQVYDKSGLAIGTGDTLNNWFITDFWPTEIPGFNGEHLVPSDPRVLYDSSNGRWYATVIAYNPISFDSVTLLGISETTNPGGAWFIYPMDVENATFGTPGLLCDQPKLGHSADKFVIGCSLFDSSATFQGALLTIGSKSQGLAGASMNVFQFGPNPDAFGLVPAQNLNPGIAAAYVTFNLSGAGTAAAAVITLTGNPATASTIGLAQTNVPMNATAFPPAAPQNGSITMIDTGDDRFMSAFVQGGALYTSGADSCTPEGDTAARSCLRLVEINLASLTLIEGVTAGAIGRYLIDPTLGVNSSGDVILVYSASSTTTFPDVETAIQPAGDPNTFVGGGQIVAGTGPYEGTTTGQQPNARWGDYSSVAVDPSAPAYVYVAGEYSNGPSDGSGGVMWSTRIAEIYGRIPVVCTAQTLGAAPVSPQAPGTSITLTAVATCVDGAAPDFQFWIKTPGTSTFALVQDYGHGDTFDWSSHTTLGTYTLQVDVRGTTETAKAYDSYASVSYVITATPCTLPTLTADPASYPQVAATPVTLTASTTCGAPPALYEFWVRTPDLVWHLAQAYSASNVYNWSTLNTQVGSYQLQVKVKNTGSLSAYDNYLTIPYAMQLCNMPTLDTGGATSPYPSGSGPITLTATGTCVGGAQFEFFYQDPGLAWHVIGTGYQSGSTATWNADYRAGSYRVQVDIRPVGSTASYVTYTGLPFLLSGCGVPTLIPNVPSPQVAGATVTWTASATCSGTPQYEFWVQSASGIWAMARAYDASSTFVWNSPNTVGAYAVQVRARNDAALEDAYDNYKSVGFTLALCNSPSLSTGAATSPYASGSGPVTLNAAGSCAGGTQFQFHYLDLSNVWHLVQAYSANNTAPWNADTKAGVYVFQVAIRPIGSTAGYVSYTRLNFTLSGCGVPTLIPDVPSPQVAGTTVTWTGSAACSGSPQYEFWVRSPAGIWAVARAYDASPTFIWNSPNALGNYAVQVRARNVGAVEDPYDNYQSISFTLALCSTPTLSTGAAASPYPSGSGPITLTATGSCAGGTQFEFFYQDPGLAWHLIGTGYQSGSTATWNADYKAGSYRVQVDIRPVGSTASYVTYTGLPFVLSGCGVPTLTPDVPSPEARGTTVTWTASAACSGTPQYEFWVRNASGVWAVARAYDASSTFIWNSPNTAGGYAVQVRARDVGALEDAYDNYWLVTYSLT